MAAIIGLAGTVSGYIIADSDITTLSIIMLVFSFISIITSLAIKYQENKKIRDAARYSVILLPFLIVLYIIFSIYSGNTLLFIISSVFICLFILLAQINLFLYTDAKALTGTIIFLILLIVGIYLKRNRLIFAGNAIALSSCILAFGYIMFGIRCLFLADQVKYLRNVSFYGSCIICISFLGQLFKLQHWPAAGWMLMIGFTSMIVGTIFILLTLHSSGFIDWQPYHKNILRRLLLPWSFIFVLFLFRFMLPDLNDKIWSPDKKIAPYGFGMSDYPIEKKNGLNSN